MGPSALHEPTWDPRAKCYVPRGTVIGGWSGLTAMGDSDLHGSVFNWNYFTNAE